MPSYFVGYRYYSHLVIVAIPYHYYSTSGSPATDVKMLIIPDVAITDRTPNQLTSKNACPTVSMETPTCAIVLIALIPAHFNHFLFMSIPPF